MDGLLGIAVEGLLGREAWLCRRPTKELVVEGFKADKGGTPAFKSEALLVR